MRILIVDDDGPMAEMLTSVCEADGHAVTACRSSRDAIDHLERHEVDLLITDIAMAPPDGLQLVRTARALRPELMAIAVTGYWGRYTLPEVLATGALDLMFKPFRVEELRARLAMAAERRRMATEEKARAQRIALSTETVRVLLIESEAATARSVRDVLGDAQQGLFTVQHETSFDRGLDRLREGNLDVALLSLASADANPERVLQAHAVAPGVPIVVMTPEGPSRDAAARVLQAGAQDYVVRGRLNEQPLQRVLLHAIERQRLLADSESFRLQQQQLREELVLHELQLKDDFMSHVSHELRSPLTAIHQFSTILMDELAGPVSHDQREALRVILRNIGQLEAMIDDLLEVTRMQNGKLAIELQAVSVPEAVADAIDTLRGSAQAKSLVVSSDVSLTLPRVYADPVRARQVLVNLLSNAVKFTPEGGSIRVGAEVDDDSGFVRFEVRDTGCGLSADTAPRIFDRLYQVRESTKAGRRGLGLGLFICKELVTQQGGRIWVESEAGRGSRFYFTLPIFGHDTHPRTKEISVKRDLLARVDGQTGSIKRGN